VSQPAEPASDPQLGHFHVCEKCHHVFQKTLGVYTRCPRCSSEFVAKFRQSHLSNYKYGPHNIPPPAAAD
jgi:DNA-directed RNA polymerase subunit RPC12/RpoP